ncbi:MAG: bifunctional 4-hydroxy-2-oxoglutarate aldolase/2-dehydro-3-deoxy-phosphogluconate aldolase [Hyphomonadaceae bacterium]
MEALKATPVIPLIQAEDPSVAVKTALALKEGGLTTLEVVWRTDAAMDCMEAIIKEVEGVTVGAGTVLTAEQTDIAAKRGAQFIVAPGLNQGVVDVSKSHGLEIYPGTATPSEVQLAWNMGLRTVKFFPAGLVGGVPMLKALSSVFRGMSFMPTGGVSAKNLKDFLSVPSVVACGGSWLTPQAEIDAGNFDAITNLAREALVLASEAR